jgi:hypothetical protein
MHQCSRRCKAEAEALVEENQPSCVHKLLEEEDARLEVEEEAHLEEVDLVVVEAAVAASDAIKKP